MPVAEQVDGTVDDLTDSTAINTDQETVDTTVETAESDKLTVVLPDDLTDKTAMEQVIDSLSNHQDAYGAKTLLKNIHKFNQHVILADKFEKAIRDGAARMSGARSNSQRKGDKLRSFRSTAEKFYNSLPTPALRMQCNLFGLQYESYDSVEDVVEALVAKHTELNGG